MATIDWPADPAFRPSRLAWGASTPKSAWSGAYTGQAQSISHLGDRLRMELTLPPCRYAEAGPREAFLMSLASTGDWVRLGHFLRPQPQGDMRGATVVQQDAAAGARSIRIAKAITPVNLLTATQSFDSTDDWNQNAALTVTPNTHARPNAATVSADSLTDASTTQTGNLTQSVAIPTTVETYTASIYVRKTSGGTSPTFAIQLTLSGGTGTPTVILRIDTDDGTILDGTGGSVSSGDGLYWLVDTSITNSSGHNSLTVRFDPARGFHGSAVTDVTATGTAVVWGAQLERGATRSEYDGTPALVGGDVVGVGSQLLITAYAGASQFSLPYLSMPLALPLRQAITAGTAVTWDKPVGTFQLLGDQSQLQYMPGRWQDAVTLQFVEAF
jgi:hypothetical protein